MNFKKLKLSNDKVILVNFDNVNEIYKRPSVGCDIYFNSLSSSEEQSYIQVEDSLEELESILIN